MLPHGPDRDAFEGVSNADLQSEKLDNTMSFMFETRFPQHLTPFAADEAPEPFTLDTGETRSFIEDGDRLSLKGVALGDGYRIGFGPCVGRLLPARKT